MTRKAVKEDILRRMKAAGKTSPVYMESLEQYMKWHDQATKLNTRINRLSKIEEGGRSLTACLTESRQLRKAMQDLLNWIGIDMDDERLESREDYEL